MSDDRLTCSAAPQPEALNDLHQDYLWHAPPQPVVDAPRRRGMTVGTRDIRSLPAGGDATMSNSMVLHFMRVTLILVAIGIWYVTKRYR